MCESGSQDVANGSVNPMNRSGAGIAPAPFFQGLDRLGEFAISLDCRLGYAVFFGNAGGCGLLFNWINLIYLIRAVLIPFWRSPILLAPVVNPPPQQAYLLRG